MSVQDLVIIQGEARLDNRSTTNILDVMLKMPPFEYIFSLAMCQQGMLTMTRLALIYRVATLIMSVFTKLKPLAAADLLTAACSAKASPIHSFSLSSAPTTTTRLLPAASYACRMLVTMRRSPNPRARMTSSSSVFSSL